MEIRKLEIPYRGEQLQIAYFIRPGKRETILYLHGLGCSKDDFLGATSTDELQAYTVTALDFPGCGNSPYPENMALGIDDLVEITNTFVSRLSLADRVIIGHSMGGLVALLSLERYGHRVRGFINVEGNLASEDCFISRKITQYSLSEFRETGFQHLKSTLSQSENKGFQHYIKTLGRYSSPKAIYDYSPSLVDYSDNGSLIQRFTQLRIPKIFIYGSENKSLSYLPQLKEKGCELVEIPESNHFPFTDNPRDYYRVISTFLKRGVLPSRNTETTADKNGEEVTA
jgi:pimeloyl-ACP methyl ester carboxylesterase